MRTYLGNAAPVIDPDGWRAPNLIDIVVHLGRTRRFGGWGDPNWTVLHHSGLVARLWVAAGYPPEEVIWALIHDDHEYITGDIPRPVKEHLSDAHLLETLIDAEIRKSLRLPDDPPGTAVLARIKIVDMAALWIEAHYFGPPNTQSDVEERDLEKLDRDARYEISRVVRAAGLGGIISAEWEP